MVRRLGQKGRNAVKRAWRAPVAAGRRSHRRTCYSGGPGGDTGEDRAGRRRRANIASGASLPAARCLVQRQPMIGRQIGRGVGAGVGVGCGVGAGVGAAVAAGVGAGVTTGVGVGSGSGVGVGAGVGLGVGTGVAVGSAPGVRVGSGAPGVGVTGGVGVGPGGGVPDRDVGPGTGEVGCPAPGVAPGPSPPPGPTAPPGPPLGAADPPGTNGSLGSPTPVPAGDPGTTDTRGPGTGIAEAAATLGPVSARPAGDALERTMPPPSGSPNRAPPLASRTAASPIRPPSTIPTIACRRSVTTWVRVACRSPRDPPQAAEPGAPIVASTRASLAIAARCSGVVPQQPPMILAPASRISTAQAAMVAGSVR